MSATAQARRGFGTLALLSFAWAVVGAVLDVRELITIWNANREQLSWLANPINYLLARVNAVGPAEALLAAVASGSVALYIFWRELGDTTRRAYAGALDRLSAGGGNSQFTPNALTGTPRLALIENGKNLDLILIGPSKAGRIRLLSVEQSIGSSTFFSDLITVENYFPVDIPRTVTGDKRIRASFQIVNAEVPYRAFLLLPVKQGFLKSLGIALKRFFALNTNVIMLGSTRWITLYPRATYAMKVRWTAGGVERTDMLCFSINEGLTGGATVVTCPVGMKRTRDIYRTTTAGNS